MTIEHQTEPKPEDVNPKKRDDHFWEQVASGSTLPTDEDLQLLDQNPPVEGL